MKRLLRALAIGSSGALALGAAATIAQQLPAGPADRVRRDITYVQGMQGPLLADVYLPDTPSRAAKRHPGIVLIHGGGWLNGSRNQMLRIAEGLTQRGYLVMTIDYDVVPARYPVAYKQSLAAVDYFRAHAAEFGLDPARIAVGGSSAGGELAALVALTPAAKVQAAVILNGVLDLPALGDTSGLVTRYLGARCSEAADACRAASPVNRVKAGAPPFYVGHGTEDKTVPFAQAETFVGLLRGAKVPVQFYVASGGAHTYWGNGRFFDDNLANIGAFLDRTMPAPRR